MTVGLLRAAVPVLPLLPLLVEGVEVLLEPGAARGGGGGEGEAVAEAGGDGSSSLRCLAT